MSFGERLRQLREGKNLTLRELEKEIGISFSALGKYERNERQPDFDTLEKIAEYFGVMIDYLIGRSDIKTFDEYVFINDVRHLGEKLKEIAPIKRKLAVDIIDSVYLVINRHLNEDDSEKLQVIKKMISSIKFFDMGFQKEGIDYEHDYGWASPSIENLETSDLLKFSSYYKNEINSYMDELINLYIKKGREQSNQKRTDG